MKKTKIIVPALGMLLLSTAASVTGTVAWFSMNTQVTASNMIVKAKAEEGLLINEVEDAGDKNWDNEAKTTQTSSTATQLYPTSTADGKTWYHAASKLEDDAAGAGAGAINSNLVGSTYDTLSLQKITSTGIGATAVAGSNAERNVFGKEATDSVGYYVMYTYYLKSSGTYEAITLKNNQEGAQNVRILKVEAKELSSNSEDLNKALRVGIQFADVEDGTFYIYNPLGSATTSYYVGGSSTATVALAKDKASLTDLASLPASDEDGTPVNIFLWFEGEDVNCKSTNLAETLDSIQIDVTFDLHTIVAADLA